MKTSTNHRNIALRKETWVKESISLITTENFVQNYSADLKIGLFMFS